MVSRFVVLYAVLYASFGVASPYMPAFIESRGIPAEQIGVVFAAGTAMRLVSAPFAGYLADYFGARKQILAVWRDWRGWRRALVPPGLEFFSNPCRVSVPVHRTGASDAARGCDDPGGGQAAAQFCSARFRIRMVQQIGGEELRALRTLKRDDDVGRYLLSMYSRKLQ
jgi:hypothetical protein